MNLLKLWIMEWKEKRADEALEQYVARARTARVQVRMHGEPAGKDAVNTFSTGVTAVRGKRWSSRGVSWGYPVAAAAAVVLGLFVLADRPQKIYGHVNGVPVTDREEAIRHSRQMFEDLAVGMAPAEDVLGNLFSL